MKKIKVLQVGIDSNLGGIETYLLELAKHIDKGCFQLDFLFYEGESPCFFKELTDLGCNFKFIRSRRKSPLGNVLDLRRLYKTERYDIVQCNVNSLSYVAPATEALRQGVKVLFLSHNAGSSRGSSSGILNFINRICFPFGKVVLAAVSDNAGEWMFGKKRDFIVLNNGVDVQRFRFSKEKRAEIRAEFGISPEQEVIAHVGAFRPQKNHLFLLDVFRKYLEHYPNTLLLLVGAGELESEVRQKVLDLGIGNSVFFVGLRKDVDAILSASDKFLFPSLYEGFPISLIEAETCGLRCIVSSSITNEVCVGNCVRVDLDSPVEKWIRVLAECGVKDRDAAFRIVEAAGLDMESSIGRLQRLYVGMVER